MNGRRILEVVIVAALSMCGAAEAQQKNLEFVPTQNARFQLKKPLPVPTKANAPALGVYGNGYDSITGTVLPTPCVIYGALLPVAGPVPDTSGDDVFSESKSLSSVRDDSKISGQASLFYAGFSASVGGGVVEGSFYDTYDRYVTAYSKRVTNQFAIVGVGAGRKLGLTQAARQALAADQAAHDKSYTTFRSVCGDHFVAGYELGGVFNAVIAVRTNQNSSYKQNTIDVGAGFAGIFGASFSSSTSHSKFMSASVVDTRDMSHGNTPAAVDVDTIYQDYHGYAAAVNARPGFIGFLYTAYSALPESDVRDIPKFDDLFAADLEILAKKKDAVTTLQNDLDDANKAIALGQTYFSVAPKGADSQTAQEEIDASKIKVAQAADACRFAKSADECKTAVQKVGTPPPSLVTLSMPAT